MVRKQGRDQAVMKTLRIIRKWMKGLFNLCLTIILIGICVYIDARYIEPKLLWVKEEQITTHKLSSETSLKVVLFSALRRIL